jgi:hypothetical protein
MAFRVFFPANAAVFGFARGRMLGRRSGRLGQ